MNTQVAISQSCPVLPSITTFNLLNFSNYNLIAEAVAATQKSFAKHLLGLLNKIYFGTAHHGFSLPPEGGFRCSEAEDHAGVARYASGLGEEGDRVQPTLQLGRQHDLASEYEISPWSRVTRPSEPELFISSEFPQVYQL